MKCGTWIVVLPRFLLSSHAGWVDSASSSCTSAAIFYGRLSFNKRVREEDQRGYIVVSLLWIYTSNCTSLATLLDFPTALRGLAPFVYSPIESSTSSLESMTDTTEDLAGLGPQQDNTVEPESQKSASLEESQAEVISASSLPSLQAQLSNDSQPASPGLDHLLKQSSFTPQSTEKIISSLEAMSPGISSRLGWSFLSSLSPKTSSEQDASLTEMSTPATGTPITPTPFSSILKGGRHPHKEYMWW